MTEEVVWFDWKEKSSSLSLVLVRILNKPTGCHATFSFLSYVCMCEDGVDGGNIFFVERKNPRNSESYVRIL